MVMLDRNQRRHSLRVVLLALSTLAVHACVGSTQDEGSTGATTDTTDSGTQRPSSSGDDTTSSSATQAADSSGTAASDSTGIQSSDSSGMESSDSGGRPEYGLEAGTAPPRPAWAEALAATVPTRVPEGAVSVEDYATPNTGTDQRVGIMNAIAAAGVGGAVDFSITGSTADDPGVWTVDPGMDLWTLSGQTLWVPPEVIVHMVKSAESFASPARLFRVIFCDGVVITGGGTLMGDVSTAPVSSHENSHLIGIEQSDNTAIVNIKTVEAWGDGVQIGGTGDTRTTNVFIKDVISTHNRRQGMSPVEVDGLWVEDCEFAYTGHVDVIDRGLPRQLPTCGVDFETNAIGKSVVNAHLVRCTFHDNVGAGVNVQNPYGSPTGSPSFAPEISEAHIWDCEITNNGGYGVPDSGIHVKEGGSLIATGCDIWDNDPYGAQILGAVGERLNQGRGQLRRSRCADNTGTDFVSGTAGHDASYEAAGYLTSGANIVGDSVVGTITHVAGLQTAASLNQVEDDDGAVVSAAEAGR